MSEIDGKIVIFSSLTEIYRDLPLMHYQQNDGLKKILTHAGPAMLEVITDAELI